MKITVLVGGAGGARFLDGVVSAYPAAQVNAVVNTGGDLTIHGLRVCPDLDMAMYLLGGAVEFKHPHTGTAQTQIVQTELQQYGSDAAWYPITDQEIATNLIRTQSLDAGYSLTEVTAALAKRWLPAGADGSPPPVTLLPMSDARCETHVVVSTDSGPRAIHVQQWRHKNGAQPNPQSVVHIGLDSAEPTVSAVDAIVDADFVLISPGNPAFSIGPILALPRLHAAIRATKAAVVGVAPVLASCATSEQATPHGVMRSSLQAIGLDPTAEAIGQHYGGRGSGGILDFWLIDTADTADVPGASTVGCAIDMGITGAAADLAQSAISSAGRVQ